MKQLFGILALVLAASCAMPVFKAPAGGTTLTFSPPHRTIGADWTSLIQSYEVTLTNTDGQGFATIGPVSPTPVNSPSLTISGVEAGEWTITVVAKDGAGVVASATLTGQTLPSATPIAITLLPSQLGSGGFQYQTSFPDFAANPEEMITSVTAELREAGTGSPIETLTASLSAPSGGFVTATFSDAAVPSGRYRLVMSFVRADGTVARAATEALNIWNNVVSSSWIDENGNPQPVHPLTAADFNSNNAELLDLTATLDGSPLTLDSGFSSSTFDYTTTILNGTNAQGLVLTPTQAMDGQEIQVSTDGGATFTTVLSGQPTASITLPKATATTVIVRVYASGSSINAPILRDYTLQFVKQTWYLDRFADGVWKANAVTLPSGEIRAIAGTADTLYVLGDQKILFGTGAGDWAPYLATPVADAQWLAASPQGELAVGSPTSLTLYDRNGSASGVPLPAAGILGLAYDPEGELWVAGSDGFAWHWTGVWEKGPAYPAGSVFLGGGQALGVATSSNLVTFDGGWQTVTTRPVGTVSLTFALDSILVLVVR